MSEGIDKELIDLYNEHVRINKEKQMDKKKAYADIVESFMNGGGREPYWEEAFAWSMGYQVAFDIARRQLKEGLELDAEPSFRPDNEIMAKNFAELKDKTSKVSEDES